MAFIRDVDRQLRQASSGPFWFGEQFTLVDIAFFPFLDRCAHPGTCMQSPIVCRLHVLERLVGFEMPQDGSCARVLAWRDAITERPSVQQTMLFKKDPGMILAVSSHDVLLHAFDVLLLQLYATFLRPGSAAPTPAPN